MNDQFVRYILTAAAIGFSGATGIAGMATAGEMKPVVSQWTAKSSLLDGKTFVGQFGSYRGGVLTTDEFVFRGGTFMSMQCKECGYPKGAYTTLNKGGRTTFVAETPCPKTDARIVWRGTLKGDRIEGVATWTQKRWYRTITKKFWFKGRLKPSGRSDQGT